MSGTGDGVHLAAMPLLAASVSRDPLALAVVSTAAWLPWLLVGLVTGALVDRWDRRRVMWRVDAARCAVVGVLVAVILSGRVSIPLLALLAFTLGVGQTLYDNATQAIIPAVIGRDPARLARANSQLQLRPRRAARSWPARRSAGPCSRPRRGRRSRSTRPASGSAPP